MRFDAPLAGLLLFDAEIVVGERSCRHPAQQLLPLVVHSTVVTHSAAVEPFHYGGGPSLFGLRRSAD